MRLLILICVGFMCVGFTPSPTVASSDVAIHPTIGYENIIPLPPLTSSAPIDHGIYYLIETEPINFEEVTAAAPTDWKHYPGQVVNFKTLSHPIWLRFDVHNSSENSSEWLLKIRYPFLDHIEVIVYHQKEKKWDAPLISGLAIPMQLRPIAHRNFLFPLTLDPGQNTTIYVRAISKTKLILPMILWKKDLFAENDAHHLMVLGIYFGILSVMLLYNISIFVFTRDKSYFFYSIYILTITVYTLMNTGIGTLYFWDNSHWLKTHAYGILSSLSFIAGTLFVRHFLSLKKYGGWVYHTNNIALVSWIGFILVYILHPAPDLIALEDLLGLFTTITGLATGIYLWEKGNIPARYFTIGWGFLMFGTFVLLFGMMDIIEFSWISSYSQMVGFVVELLFLSFALSDQIKRDRAARDEARQVALELTQKISRELEQRVHDRTIDLKKAMLRLKKVNQELSQLTITDPLTKVYNRRHFNDVITNEVKRANRTLQPIAVIMVDIDHFKAINDTHGHPVGDKCLYLVARTLRQQMARSVDLVARYGGEEFVMVLAATPKEKAVLLAEKVRRAVEKLAVINKGVPIKLRVSLGVAAWIPDQDESHEKLVQAADQALYQAKRDGRNQVVAHGILQSNYLN